MISNVVAGFFSLTCLSLSLSLSLFIYPLLSFSFIIYRSMRLSSCKSKILVHGVAVDIVHAVVATAVPLQVLLFLLLPLLPPLCY